MNEKNNYNLENISNLSRLKIVYLLSIITAVIKGRKVTYSLDFNFAKQCREM